MTHEPLATTGPMLSRGVDLGQTVVLVDGLPRSGKSLLGPILASFERVEIEGMEEMIDYIGTLHQIGKLETDAAVTLLRMQADMHLLNGMLGRNTNFRFGDHSSVWGNGVAVKYLRRLFHGAGEAVVRRIAAERPIYQNQTHDQLVNFPLHREAFGARLRMLEMIRHPVDLADSWLRRGWGERFGVDPRAMTLCVRHGGEDVPFYAIGWEEEYHRSSPIGRVLRMIAGLWDGGWATYAALTAPERAQVMIVPLEEFVQRPAPYLEAIAAWLGTRTARGTARALRRARCPRTYAIAARDRRQRQIADQASREDRALLERLVESYERTTAAFVIRHD